MGKLGVREKSLIHQVLRQPTTPSPVFTGFVPTFLQDIDDASVNVGVVNNFNAQPYTPLQWIVHQVAHGFVVGNIVTDTPNTPQWVKSVNNYTDLTADAIVAQVIDVDNFVAQQFGLLTLTTGQWDTICGTSGGLAKEYYWVGSTAGTLTATKPSGIGNFQQVCIKGLSATQAEVLLPVDAFAVTLPPASFKGSVIEWWTFEQAQGAPQTNSVNSNNLILAAIGDHKIAGLVNLASLLDFDAYYIGNAPVDLSTGDFTIVGVFRTNSHLASLGIISEATNPPGATQWTIYLDSTGHVNFNVSSDGTAIAANIITSGTYTDDAFHTFMAWRDTANNLIALAIDSDGSSPLTSALSGSTALFTPLTQNIQIGAVGHALFTAGGAFDETGVFNRLLSSAERTFLYNGGAWRTYSDLP